MRVLLLSMPDSFEHTPALTMRMPNGALASLAGNAGPGHVVAVADLILAQDSVAATVERLVREHDPDVVGLSIMTFQRRTALRVIRLIRTIKPGVRIVAGGYDPSLAPEAYEPPSSGVDFIVRGEGELTFRALLRALSRDEPVDAIPGLTFRPGAPGGGGFRHTPNRPVNGLDDGAIALPDRGARVLTGYTFLGRPIDIVETSRGCTYDCSFCSIIEMRGRNFHTFDFSRVLADIGDARRRGARAIFLVDDNITLNVGRFEGLCQAIIDAGLNDVHYIVQAMTSSIADHGETLAPLMRKAGSGTCSWGSRTCSTRISRSCARRPRTRRAKAGGGPGTPPSARSSICIEPACRSWAASSSGIPTTRAPRSRRTWRLPGVTWTGPTSSTRRRIRARR